MTLSASTFNTHQSEQKNLPNPLDMLLRLGNFYELDFNPVNTRQIEQELENLKNNWVQYNPYKPHIARKAISITSLDGSINGKPDLYSLREFYRQEGVLFKESDFRVLTPNYERLPSLKDIIGYFAPYLGRTHVLRFDAGGFFPPHRDAAAMLEPDTFRIIVPLTNITRNSFVFLYGNERLHLENGTPYFLNTLIDHSAFSFIDNATMLVCNIILNHESVRLLKARLAQK